MFRGYRGLNMLADVKYIEQQLKEQFEVQKEVYDAEIRCLKEKCKQLQKELDIKDDVDNQVILAYDKDLRRANTKLDKIQEIVSDELNLNFDVTGKLKEIKEIIGE